MKKVLLLSLTFFAFLFAKSQNYYFPSKIGSQWDTVSLKSLGWCTNQLDTVYKYLEEKNSKGFIILKGGKIAVEKYFDGFTKDSVWYWASAGKSLTAVLVGIAQQEGKLSINDTASKHLGKGWTVTTSAQEAKISIKNLLTMTSGLSNTVLPNPNCTAPNCFKYKADAGTRWAYHSGAYYMLHTAIENTTGQSINQYTNQKLRNTTGMKGVWAGTLFLSRARDMARFGSLVINKGIWDKTKILNDTNYFNAMVNTSQSINPAYGYLWWLNGKASYKGPLLQTSFNGSLIPNAPADMFAGLGKNDQKIYIIPSMDMVIVRVGNASGQPTLAASSFDSELWGLLKGVFCATTSVNEVENYRSVKIYPNPVANILTVETDGETVLEIFSMDGKSIVKIQASLLETIDVSNFNKGIYTIRLTSKHGVSTAKFVKK